MSRIHPLAAPLLAVALLAAPPASAAEEVVGAGSAPLGAPCPNVPRYPLSVSMGVAAAPYVLMATDDLRFKTFVGLTVQPELRFSYRIKPEKNGKAFLAARWTGLGNLGNDAVSSIAPKRTNTLEGAIAVGFGIPLNDGGTELMDTSLKRLSISVGYGNFKLDEQRHVQGVTLMVSLDADILAFGFDKPW